MLIDGQPAPHLYRWCRISSGRVRPGHSDDYAALAEAIVRRFSTPVAPCAPAASSIKCGGGGDEEGEGCGGGEGGGDGVKNLAAESRHGQGKRGVSLRKWDEEADRARHFEAELPDVVCV